MGRGSGYVLNPFSADSDRTKNVKVRYSKEQIMKNFKSMDKNGDSKLSKAELEAGFIKLGASWGSARAWLALWHADANNDGYIDIDTELDKLVEYALSVGYTLD